MENPEEVLQALDEFQKMRPSEIPRELEEYLCWVAKTGDPVYQWSLVKPLFREKLTRVMTDFYESCPSLELAPCPNVEQFNYDIMKCALLELLDSFANAPFTVQRICELLTAPRKEYNRVDKFMRAIEKNILVVSTREPGPAARRSENGDVMVNGSVEDDALSGQSTHEVEMESWVKDCAVEPNAATIVAPGETDVPATDSPIVAKAPKTVPMNDESLSIMGDKNESQTSRIDATDSETVSPESSADSSVASSDATPPAKVCDTRVQDCSNNIIMPPMMTNDAPDAVMNEDTSSQPSLDSETDDIEFGALRKLQTAFESRDFMDDRKSPKSQVPKVFKNDDKPSKVAIELPIAQAVKIGESIVSPVSIEKSISPPVSTFEPRETVLPIVDNVLEKRPRSVIEDNDPNGGDNLDDDADIGSPLKRPCSSLTETTESSNDSTSFVASPLATKKTDVEASTMDDNTIETTTEDDSTCVDRLAADETTSKVAIEDTETKNEETTDTKVTQSDAGPTIEPSDDSQPIIEEPPCDETNESSSKSTSKNSNDVSESRVTIEETMDDDTRINKSIIPDPIPIVEEPKEIVTASRNSETGTVITELIEDTKILSETVIEAAESSAVVETTIVEETAATSMNEEAIATIVEQTPQEDITDVRSTITEIDDKIEPAESMEVDGDEAMTVFQQDEPMEEEPGDLMKS